MTIGDRKIRRNSALGTEEEMWKAIKKNIVNRDRGKKDKTGEQA